jgi:hypothetical protein
MIPLAGLSGVFDAAGFWQNMATFLSTAALWAQQRAHKPEPDPVDELTERLRHPIRWTMRHPFTAIKRKARPPPAGVE